MGERTVKDSKEVMPLNGFYSGSAGLRYHSRAAKLTQPGVLCPSLHEIFNFELENARKNDGCVMDEFEEYR